MVRMMLGVVVLLVGCVARAEDFPKLTLAKGEVSIDLYLPDAERGFYRGLRYDHSGMVAQARWRGHTFFGELVKPHDPKVHDHGAGTVEEFGMELHRPLGYDAAKVGEGFLKIGVGVLEKRADPKGYGFAKDYKVLHWPKWDLRHGADWAEFRQTAALPGGALGYELAKRVEVTPDGFRIVRRLKNTGREKWTTDHYGHNHVVIDEKPVGPEYVVKVGFAPTIAEQKGGARAGVSERDVRIERPLEKEAVWTRLVGFSQSPRENVMRVEHDATRVGVEIATDRPIRRWVLFALRSAICPEAFVELEVVPGQTVDWTTGYRLYRMELGGIGGGGDTSSTTEARI